MSPKRPNPNPSEIPLFACVVSVKHNLRREDGQWEPHFGVTTESPDGVKVFRVSPECLASRRKFVCAVLRQTGWPIAPCVGRESWEACVADMLNRGRIGQNASQNEQRPLAG
jgi:hypothetical protein